MKNKEKFDLFNFDLKQICKLIEDLKDEVNSKNSVKILDEIIANAEYCIKNEVNCGSVYDNIINDYFYWGNFLWDYSQKMLAMGEHEVAEALDLMADSIGAMGWDDNYEDD